MSPLPEEVVTAAAEELHRQGCLAGTCSSERLERIAGAILAAAFAELPECEEAVQVVAKRLQPIRYVKDADDPHYSYRLDLGAARELLADLAKWGQL